MSGQGHERIGKIRAVHGEIEEPRPGRPCAFQDSTDLREVHQLQYQAAAGYGWGKLDESDQATMPSRRRCVSERNLHEGMASATGYQFGDSTVGNDPSMMDEQNAITRALDLLHIVRAVNHSRAGLRRLAHA
jgi:hypothetical protein